ncbi:hypothetical protein [Nocardioides acrostichi]|uniref:Uncharacterized protein n=1 Tax=Nocardioides acrostichi TaxID=2784339 RepID=A0A930Y880_9ACTN|nr:hypothetical protein [Nocardioides acrostichi]MBF4162786.1 hypothetical protein [Nocardioides acrostichi]
MADHGNTPENTQYGSHDDTRPLGASGSRWEPQPGTTGAAGAEDPSTVPGARADAPPSGDAATPRSWREKVPTAARGRAGIAGAAAGLLAVGGLGGFAIGHATASSGDEFQQAGFTTSQNGQNGQNGQQFGQPGGQQFGQPGGQTDSESGVPGQGSPGFGTPPDLDGDHDFGDHHDFSGDGAGRDGFDQQAPQQESQQPSSGSDSSTRSNT